jgi:glutathione S-transferase
LIALYENATPFEFCLIEHDNAQIMAELESLWPFKRFPVWVDGAHTVREASIIIEHLALYHPGPVSLLPNDARAALEVRFMDRFFDNYVMTPQGKLVFDSLRKPENRDSQGVTEARAMLETAYRWLDREMQDREWAAGATFSLADCAAAPALFYADWSYPIDVAYKNVHAYRQRLLARPSFARAVDEARPYRKYFPLGAPDRD